MVYDGGVLYPRLPFRAKALIVLRFTLECAVGGGLWALLVWLFLWLRIDVLAIFCLFPALASVLLFADQLKGRLSDAEHLHQMRHEQAQRN